MVALAANLPADQEWIPLSEADSLSLPVGFYTIDSENVKVETGPHPASAISNPMPKYNGRRAIRGVGGSTPASHTSGATLTRYYPDAPSAAPGGSGIPDGGTTGQALVKASDDDGDAAWGTPTLAQILDSDNDANGNPIINLGAPTQAADAATKSYVDAAVPDEAVDPGDIADPATATAEDVADRLNLLLANMRTAGMLEPS